MTVLVTGGAGYIGGHTVLALFDRNDALVVLDDLSAGTRNVIPSSVPFVLGDVGDVALIARVIREHQITSILHFAGKIVVPESVVDPLKYYLHNTYKTGALLEAAVREGVEHFVFSSTAAVYGEADGPVSEDAHKAPLSPYGTSKLMSEQILRDVGHAYGLKFAILRYFNVAGADPSGRFGQTSPGATHLIKVAMETALGKRPGMSIYGDDYSTADGSCVRDYIHVSDLADAHLTALDHLHAGGASCTLNCGYGRGYSVKQVVSAVKQVTGVDFQVDLAPRRLGDVASVIADSARLFGLGWRPALDDLTTIIRHAYNWEKSLVEPRA